jgi:hypothetical protein
VRELKLMENALMGRCFKIFDELLWKSTTSYEEIYFGDLAGIGKGKRFLLAAILGDKGRENGATIFRSRSISLSFQQSMTIKYTLG